MPRSRITVTMDPSLLEWMDNYVEDNIEFKDRSHFMEVLVYRYREGVEAKQ